MDNFMNHWKELRETRIGLEFEFFSKYEYVKTLEILNNTFNPLEVYGFNVYHSDFEVSNTKFKIEPDFSGGSEMIELITGPMEYNEAKIITTKMLQFINEHGHTTEDSSIHINISFNDIQVKDLKPVKLILNINEDYIYTKFPDRENNIYARSIKYIMPFENFSNVEYGMNYLLNSFTIPDESKYYGINFLKLRENYIEYRYIGGKNYETKKIEIFSLMDYFILQTRNAILDDYTQDDYIKLSSYLSNNMYWYKQYKTYDEFLMNIDGISIEVDQSCEYDDIKQQWGKFNDKLFELLKNVDNIKGSTINFNTFTNRLEIINANIDSLYLISHVDFVECRINAANLYNCDIIETEIINSHIYNSNIYNSKINDSKLNNVKATKYTEITDSVFNGGVLDCIMTGGVFRSGKITYNADIDNTVKMTNTSDFWMISDVTGKEKLKK